MRRRILILTSVAVAIVAIAMAAIWVNQPTDAMAMLDESASAASQLCSFRYRIAATQIEHGHEVRAVTVGEVSQDDLHVKTIASDGTYEETVRVGDKAFYRTGNSEWQVTQVPNPCETCSMSASVAQIAEALADVEVVGEEMVNGTLTTHLAGHSDMAQEAKRLWPDFDTADPEMQQYWELPRQQFLAGTQYVDLWVANNDKLITRMRAQASFPAVLDLEPYSFDTTIDYFDFNADITIEAPQVATP